jgi:serine/threonine protein kinase
MTQSRLLGGRYDLDDVVGEGGMAEVYRARDIRLDRIVALKTPRADPARYQIFQVRLRRVASLNHPNIVAVYDTGEDTATGVPVPYIVMEFVDGCTVRDLLQVHHRLTLEGSLVIIDRVLHALDHSHQAGIVHRDIKPENVMVTLNGDVKVKDFAVVQTISDPEDADLPEVEVIDTQYLSPEQIRGERVDSRSDLYSTGCLMYELLTGRPPFTGDSPVAIAYCHVRENPIPPSRVNPDVPAWADAIVLKAMAKSPADRYQKAADMRADLQRAAAGLDAEPAPSLVVLKRPCIVRISEAPARRAEKIGDEVRLFNNAKSSSTAVETIKVSHVARVSASVDVSKTRALSANAGIRFINIVNAQAGLANDLLRRYSLQLDSELTYEQTTEINIPPHTSVEVTFHWFRIWVTGMLTLSGFARRAAEVAEVPFEITIGLNFDKETRDID